MQKNFNVDKNKNIFFVILFLMAVVQNIQSALVQATIETMKYSCSEIKKEILPSALFNAIRTVTVRCKPYIEQGVEKFCKTEKNDVDLIKKRSNVIEHLIGALLSIPFYIQSLPSKFFRNCIESPSESFTYIPGNIINLPLYICFNDYRAQEKELRTYMKILSKNFNATWISSLSFFILTIINFAWVQFLYKQTFSRIGNISYVAKILDFFKEKLKISELSARTGVTSFYQLDLSVFIVKCLQNKYKNFSNKQN